jgi:hypothetical protein
MFKEVKMTGLKMIRRISWVGLCSAAAVAAAVFVACGGPTPLDVPLGATGPGAQKGSGGGANGSSTAPIISGIGGSTGSVATTPAEVTEATSCALTTANLTKQPADLLLVLDKSGSMTSSISSTNDCQNAAAGPDAGSCQERWGTMVSGLNAVLSGASGDVNWGLQLFNIDGTCGVAAAPEVPIAPGSAATVQQTIAGVTPNGNTPTRAAINAGVAYLQTLTDTNGKYILLATDGEPNCLTTSGGGKRGGGGGSGSGDVPGTVAAITAAAALGYKVYVIGVGPETGNLDNFALAGGTDHYYPALSPQDLNAALATIVGTVASCTFSLGKAPPDPSNVAVQFNGDKSLRAPHDTTHTDGWDYSSSTNTTIQLYGSWCDNVTNGTYTAATILEGCPGQTFL